jgi:hypothetical protein
MAHYRGQPGSFVIRTVGKTDGADGLLARQRCVDRRFVVPNGAIG